VSRRPAVSSYLRYLLCRIIPLSSLTQVNPVRRPGQLAAEHNPPGPPVCWNAGSGRAKFLAYHWSEDSAQSRIWTSRATHRNIPGYRPGDSATANKRHIYKASLTSAMWNDLTKPSMSAFHVSPVGASCANCGTQVPGASTSRIGLKMRCFFMVSSLLPAGRDCAWKAMDQAKFILDRLEANGREIQAKAGLPAGCAGPKTVFANAQNAGSRGATKAPWHALVPRLRPTFAWRNGTSLPIRCETLADLLSRPPTRDIVLLNSTLKDQPETSPQFLRYEVSGIYRVVREWATVVPVPWNVVRKPPSETHFAQLRKLKTRSPEASTRSRVSGIPRNIKKRPVLIALTPA